MKWNKLNNAVYTSDSKIVHIDTSDIAILKDNIQHAPDNRIRICTHHENDIVHEMIIAINKESYIRPHKHNNKSESFHMVEGEMDVVIFDDAGKLLKIISMGQTGSGKSFFYRLSSPFFHTVYLRTEYVIFHETTHGPFIKEDTLMAPWSPQPSEKHKISLFISKLEQDIQTYANNP